MSTIETLEQIVGSSIKVENLFVPGNQKAKGQLKDCLPIERETFEELATDKKNDFRPGYDGVYPRVPMDIVYASTKKMNGKVVPAFAIYNVFKSEKYERTFAISSKDYSSSSDIDKQVIPHNKSKMSFYEHLWKRYTPDVGIPFVCGGIIFQAANLLYLGQSTLAHVSGSVMSAIGIMMVVYGIFILMRAGTSVNYSRKFTHIFSGIIPDNVRTTIKNEKKNFDQILLVEESYNWTIDYSVKLEQKPNPDPLIIGKKNELYFLIDKFDVTPLEHFIATEMSV